MLNLYNKISLFIKKFFKKTPRRKKIDFDIEALDLFINLVDIKKSQDFSINKLVGGGKNTNKTIGCIVLGTARYFSKELLQSVRAYIKQGMPTVAIVNTQIRQHSSYKTFKNFQSFKNFNLYLVDPSVPLSTRLAEAAKALECEYITVFTPRDQTNRRSFVTILTSILFEEEADIYLPTGVLDRLDTLEARRASPFISALTGVFFKRTYLLQKLAELPTQTSFWLARNLLGYDKTKISTFTQHLITKNDSSNIYTSDIATIYRDWQTNFSPGNCEDNLNDLLVLVRLLRANCAFNDLKAGLLLSVCSLAVLQSLPYLEEQKIEDYKYLFSTLFNFDQVPKRQVIQAIHTTLVTALIPEDSKTLAVIESEGMEDLKYSLLPRLSDYTVIYIKKPQYYDYHFFNCLVLRAQIQPAALVLSSNDMHAYITSGKDFFVLWHGLGMLKDIVTPNRLTYPITYLTTSSRDCVNEWSKCFDLDMQRIFPVGSIQTDCLFDSNYVRERREQVRAAYGIPETAKLVFFAPTFRMGEPRYYDFGMDIDVFAEHLAQANIYLVTKKHHIFLSILKDSGVDTSGVKNSVNRHFIVSEDFEFLDLLCASDVFVTDYSSGLFYAILRNMPIVLYAPDLNEYLEGLNGLMIKYPEEIPAQFVGKADPTLLCKALQDAENNMNKEQYEEFKKHHVGACDGQAGNRVLKLINCIVSSDDHEEILCGEESAQKPPIWQ